MAAHDWLASYHDVQAIDAAINGISRRFRRANPLLGGAQEMLDNYAPLQENFLRFFPELMQFVRATREQAAVFEVSVSTPGVTRDIASPSLA